MISKVAEEMIGERQEKFLIPAEIVANVQESNRLDHAFLVLTKARYAKIPVLDSEQKFKGLLSLAMITDTMLGLNGIDPSNLHQLTVADVMQTDVPKIQLPYDIEDILHLSVNNPFLVVTTQEGVFTGIVTRREILKGVNHMVHELDKRYEITLKN
ncbi:cyclic-di-AMP-binding protein CbpB [Ligilactobacillus sp. Marseille-Q7487]|jgi:predicted transcriptional regulator|uniref:cyclic-di-AMP-binding protein CbpB n=1 Tax=Ligilactobacillus sp. Marseille-Q7487 TaxID=3022128 RepID=UPI0015B51B56|nr:cyclic-di-AMP-binding protein CbpB [Ligilactobacillus sp. Marseille-Q7487]